MTTRDDGTSANRKAREDGLGRRDVIKGAGALALTGAALSGAGVADRAAWAQVPGDVGQVTTSDGVRLYYLAAGSGKPILMIPGWSQTAEQFKHQITGLSDRYRVIAVDMRGHGESDKPEFGFKISRLAKDVHDMIHALDLDEVNILGHSMGCSVIWNYYDLFGPERLSKLLLIDQMPMIRAIPHGRRRSGSLPARSSIRSRCTRRSMRWPARTGSRPPAASSATWSPSRSLRQTRPGSSSAICACRASTPRRFFTTMPPRTGAT